MALATPEEIVTAGVAAQALIDRHMTLAYEAAAKLVRVTERGVEEGWVQGVAAKKIIADARSGQGAIAAVMAHFATLHQAQVTAATLAGADLGSVTTAGGITIGGIGILGGGR